MAESLARATRPLMRDLERLRGIGRWWWGTLLLSWATTLILLVSLLWLWISPGSDGIGLYQTFTYEGRTFLMLPEGTEALTCRQGEQGGMSCVVLPLGERSPARPPVRPGAERDGS